MLSHKQILLYLENDPGVVIVQSKCQKGSVHKNSGLLQDMHGGVLVRRNIKEWLAGSIFAESSVHLHRNTEI